MPSPPCSYYGGWVAPNIYYIGAAGCVEVGGLVIAGVSGIYKSHDFTLGRHERMPYNAGSVRSVYHTRCFDTYRLHMLARAGRQKDRHARQRAERPAVILSHDWPNTIEQHGDVQWLVRKKPFFREEVKTGTLGSPPLYDLLCDLKPAYWFSAHLHVRFAALVRHGKPSGSTNTDKIDPSNSRATSRSGDEEAGNNEEMPVDMDDDEGDASSDFNTTTNGNPDEIAILNDEDDGEEVGTLTQVPSSQVKDINAPSETRFLALSKCLEGQDFLQTLEVEAPCDANDTFRTSVRPESNVASGAEMIQPTFRFHAPWLAILRASDPFLSLERRQTPLPDLKDAAFLRQISAEEDWVEVNCQQNRQLSTADEEGCDSDQSPLAIRKLQRFVRTAPSSTDPEGTAFGPREFAAVVKV